MKCAGLLFAAVQPQDIADVRNRLQSLQKNSPVQIVPGYPTKDYRFFILPLQAHTHAYCDQCRLDVGDQSAHHAHAFLSTEQSNPVNDPRQT